MQVILLERVAKLGQMGEVVDVKPGYARNYLLPQGKALSASKANVEAFEGQKAQLEAQNLETKKEAEQFAEGRFMAPSPPVTPPMPQPPKGSPSTASRSFWATRSRNWACMTCASSCTPKSMPQSS